MSKKSYKGKKKNLKWLEIVFVGMIVALVALLILRAVTPESTDYVITGDGHVHTADGAHVGTYEEVFGASLDGVTTTVETPTDLEPTAADKPAD